jgi:hypothetical protein
LENITGYELNPGEENREYSSTYSNYVAQSTLDSEYCWDPAEQDSDPYLTIDAGAEI